MFVTLYNIAVNCDLLLTLLYMVGTSALLHRKTHSSFLTVEVMSSVYCGLKAKSGQSELGITKEGE
jgi:hypothetical protein